MLRKRSFRHQWKTQNAQSMLEYVIVIGVIVTVLFTMNPMLKRSIQGLIKFVADQVGNQENAEQDFDETGYLQSQHVKTQAAIHRTESDFLGVMNYISDEVIVSESNTQINAGFTETD
ncbi:MAG: hypothetical protein Q7S13_00675 [Candidatus Omnitrophota bacterium]|nr:hypothetical protein [Candidatus Omnitrophota bacterium]